jgi:hypothetical protein
MPKYVRPLLAAASVFACCFLLLKFWLNLQSIAAAIAAGISAAGTFLSAVLGLVKTTLEIEKLKQENRKLKREESEALRTVRSPTLEEIDKYGLKPRPFVSDTHEKRL